MEKETEKTWNLEQQELREHLTEMFKKQDGKSQVEAERLADRMIRRYEAGKQKVEEVKRDKRFLTRILKGILELSDEERGEGEQQARDEKSDHGKTSDLTKDKSGGRKIAWIGIGYLVLILSF